jgi:hypothetical protein
VDLVLFVGPVILRDSFKRIDWYGRDVRIVPCVHEDSSYWSERAEQLRDAQGRILPNLVRAYAGVELGQVDQVALAAFSAGHGLLNKVGAVPADRERLSAMLLHDATFSGFNDPPKAGYVAMGRRAIDGSALMVSTTSLGGGVSYATGRDSWLPIWNTLQQQTGRAPMREFPGPALAATGTWWRLGGSCVWGDLPNVSHVGQHDLAPTVWQQWLAPYLARWRYLGPLLVGAAVGGLGLGALTWWRRRAI